MALDSAFVYSGAREGEGPCCCALLFISRITAANPRCGSPVCLSSDCARGRVYLLRAAPRRRKWDWPPLSHRGGSMRGFPSGPRAPTPCTPSSLPSRSDVQVRAPRSRTLLEAQHLAGGGSSSSRKRRGSPARCTASKCARCRALLCAALRCSALRARLNFTQLFRVHASFQPLFTPIRVLIKHS